ncbi:unnamed protein product [Heterobilharzia americana]|nr:unnamed protein product [Heterobilharzia americana]
MNDKSLTSGDRNAKLKPKFILTRGIHVFDFEFQLPADLPGSFELPTNCLAGGASASITYAVRLEICNNRLKMRHIQQREIIVFRPLELIHFPRLRDRITLHREFVSLGCCSNPGGLILCDLAVNKTGFVPGETIIPQIHITNRSSQAIQTVHLTFAQTVFLKGANNQNHIEVLRIFATRLNAQPTVLGFDLFEQLDMNSLGGLFSPSNSFSSRSSTNRVDRIQQQQHRQFDMKQKNCRNTNSHSNQRQKSRRRHQNHHSSSAPIVAVSGQGGKAYFTDLIHVPPLPTSGLFGRQNLIHVEYSLILRLRMQGDKEGKHDHCMQIPITIGSDPTRETSFIGNSEVVPCYASFNFASGDIVEYDPLNQNNSTRMTPVYRYFKPKPMEQTANKSNITFSSDSPVNSSSIKSLQNTSKSSPSILKPTGTSSTSTNTGTGNSTNISGENRQYSLKSNKSLYCTEHSQKSPRHQQQVKQQLSSLVYSPDDAVVASFTTLYNSDGAKSDTCSYNQILNKKHKQVSSYKLRRQNNFQELTPHKTHISLSAGVITNPINLDTRSPELCLSNQQFFDDGDVTLSNMTNSADDNVISTSFRSNKLNKDNALNFSFSKDQSQIIHQPIQHLKYLDGNERACLSSGLREHHHPHDSSVCSKYVENSSLEYKCKSQTNIPLRQYSFGLFSDERSSFDDREDCRNQRHQSNEYCQQYSSELVRPKQIHYGVDDDEENNEEEEDEDDNIPYESNNDDVTSDEMNKYTLKTNHFYLTPNDNSEGCTGRLLNPDNLSRSRSTSSSNFSQNEEEEEYDDDLDDDLNNTCEEENAMGNHEDDILAADKEGESDKNYTDQQQKQNQQNLQQHRLKTYQDESLSQASLNLNHTPSDIKELYFKVQQISDQKNISINYKFKQSKNIHDAYWNSPRVAPIAGRKAETEGFWTYGHGNASQNKETSA